MKKRKTRKRRVKSLRICSHILIGFVLFFFVTSCSEEGEKVKDFGEVVPRSTKTTKIFSPTKSKVDSVKIKFYEKISHLSIDSVVDISKSLLPDRFNPVKKLKETLYFGKDSLQFCEWKYKDTNNLKQALYNLMDCFESPCKPFKMYESIPVCKSHFSILCNEKTLILIKSSFEIKLNEWLIFLDKEKGYNSFELIISQPKNGKTKWFYSKNTKLTPKTK